MPSRLLIVLPSWLGDTVMATPTIARLRAALGPTAVIAGLCRPGLDELLAGLDTLDDLIVADARKLMGPAKVASRLVPFRFDAALLLPNSFSTAMTVRLAGIPQRIGYDRDGRGLLLTVPLQAPRRPPPHGGWAPISAVDYYLRAADAAIEALGAKPAPSTLPPVTLSLPVTDAQQRATDALLNAAGLASGQPYALLNPGGNDPAKRWPVERFAAAAHHLIARHKLPVLINGSPAERDLTQLIKQTIILADPADEPMVRCLPELGVTIGSLKGLVRGSAIVITNDTGPRHLAAAFDRPCVTLFGPTDPRWTTLPPRPDGSLREITLVADPTLPPEEVADDHPDRCRVDRIGIDQVTAAADRLLGG
jgi:heptosyltransferase-2